MKFLTGPEAYGLFQSVVIGVLLSVPNGLGQLVDPTTVKCGANEYTWCNYENGLVQGVVPRKCSGQCLCEGHPSFAGDNLDWIDGKCVTTEGYACGSSTDGTMFVHCETGTQCIAGRCRKPNFQKNPLGGKCRDDVECLEGKCRAHNLYSPPLPGRQKRALPPQWCCSTRETKFNDEIYTLETVPCNKN